MSDDTELLRRYAEDGDESAFAELVQRHLGLVYHTALRHVGGDAHSAQDVSQAVFTELARRSRTLLRYTTLGGWLYARSRYASLDSVRSRQRRQVREERAQLMIEPALGSELVADWAQLQPVIDQAMHSLSERDRDAVYLRYFEGRPFAEVGIRFGLSEEAIRKRIERAMEKLRRSLKGLGVTSTTSALAVVIATQAGGAVPIGLAEAISGGALAVSGGPATGLAALLHLMSTTKAIAGVGVAACLLVAGYSGHEQTAIRAARVALAQENSASTAAFQELQRLKQKISQRNQDLALARLAESQRQTATAAAVRGTSPQRISLGKHGLVPGTQRWATSAVDQELIKDTDVQKFFRLNRLTVWSAVYGPLFQATGWSAAQIAALENLKLQQNQPVGNTVLTLRPEDVAPNQIRESLQNLLGADGYQQYEAYDRTVWSGGLVSSSLAGNLYDSGTPLTTEQASQLTQLIATSTGEAYSHAANIDWAIALPEAQEILSPPQYAALQNIAKLMVSGPNLGDSLYQWAMNPGAFGNSYIPPSSPLALSYYSAKK